ncbi:MAG: hypothetical protein ACD_30C00110G0002 [uncultured bacterium]|uniref:Uncharacterized protein n=3 Tax=Candidatus Daviesiibacteriota TaxID=1752718 RepID=A0A0G0HEF6_9BACT|nr:MAG: hypothetical protein ACD_30C00110G0002 [uncultured bacterium]KKQ10499.1 MAG: hypothetical protein US19_C0004G0047 [Candidatus Daviesbacteria bacterium GW2011_GWB1_36_5]KKQ15680.1 MAG: hypothetical protein US28_C0012G0017 [Candidatus Daviesbacteria bacterium GW2011_GWA1_36_8]OGE33045.1 MAG: hypothetical protein A3C99_02125 [Candidatus Daviesbacteria bacterium RIFCSPHIGHO2_02_FULL_37_9]OGE36205.1 MAG: hypothetical protein A3E66_05360 [Candidatus Daviesbacteria bacterium RIFCSPHIGHO2_12_FU
MRERVSGIRENIVRTGLAGALLLVGTGAVLEYKFGLVNKTGEAIEEVSYQVRKGISDGAYHVARGAERFHDWSNPGPRS